MAKANPKEPLDPAEESEDETTADPADDDPEDRDGEDAEEDEEGALPSDAASPFALPPMPAGMGSASATSASSPSVPEDSPPPSSAASPMPGASQRPDVVMPPPDDDADATPPATPATVSPSASAPAAAAQPLPPPPMFAPTNPATPASAHGAPAAHPTGEPTMAQRQAPVDIAPLTLVVDNPALLRLPITAGPSVVVRSIRPPRTEAIGGLAVETAAPIRVAAEPIRVERVQVAEPIRSPSAIRIKNNQPPTKENPG